MKRLVHYQFLSCAAVICGVLVISTLSKSEVQAFDMQGTGTIENNSTSTADAAQDQRVERVEDSERVRRGLPTLGCCRCLGDTNTLDLSTIITNNWIVTDPSGNSSSAALVSPINISWNLNTGPAQWVSTNSNGGTNILPAGFYKYSLSFLVPVGAIQQSVNLAGTCGGDDTISVYLDSTSSANLLTSCTSGWCFNLSNPPPPFFCVVAPGLHTLIVIVNNSGGPTGVFVNAKLTGTCVSLFCRG